ncbi:hypothetical protein NDK50_20455 [Paraburkholderia bryophila]|uniref:hypothetical protein n=1 Tax=Paraburkholderia bryophila TaxID=420952 RepID=UPI00234943A2|nr:hypothetical protein [Paraburkholderia bryophila]WCM19753.1 hypothetical protein NDK50_20455 [Paraburkholderia bryophila]
MSNVADVGACDRLAIKAAESNLCTAAPQKSESSPIDQGATTMNGSRLNLTAGQLSDDSSVWFSAYGIGWGYCAFALPAVTVCEKLGAANGSPKELMLAFEFGRRLLLSAIEQKALASIGERITLSSDDL